MDDKTTTIICPSCEKGIIKECRNKNVHICVDDDIITITIKALICNNEDCHYIMKIWDD